MEAILILAGVLIGIGLSTFVFRVRSVGVLRIDNSDPTDGPYMFLELDKGVGDISRQKNILLRVKRENYIPHK